MSSEKSAGKNKNAPLWVMLASCVMTVFYYQATRDILISRNLVKDILPVIIAIVAGPVVSVIIFYIIRPMPSAVLGTLACTAGRMLLLSQDMNHYYAGEVLLMAGYPLFMIGLLGHINRPELPSGYRNAAALSLASGVVTGVAAHILLRQVEETGSLTFAVGLAAAGLIGMAMGAFEKPGMAGGETPPPEPASWLKVFSLAFLPFAFHLLFMCLGKPEFLASRCALPYRVAVLAVAVGLMAACVVAAQWESSGSEARGPLRMLLLVGNILAAGWLLILYSVPEAAWQVLMVAFTAAVVGLDVYRICSYAVNRRSRLLPVAAGAAMLMTPFATFALDGLLLENHWPSFQGWVMLPLALFSALIAWYEPAAPGEGRAPWTGQLARFAVIPVVGLLVVFAFTSFTEPKGPGVEPLVFASLYTWYGTPDGVYGGTYGSDFSKEGEGEDFKVEKETMQHVASGYNDDGWFFVSGVPNGPGEDEVKIGFGFPAALLYNSGPTFVSIGNQIKNGSANLTLEITVGKKLYSARLNGNAEMALSRLAWPDDFTVKDAGVVMPEDTAHLSITLQAPDPEYHILFIDYVRFSSWKHWNEDYKAYFDKAKNLWFNDPPRTLAAAHRVNYSGEPWPEIAPYSPAGYYDSLDRAVMTSQLQLMEKAGLDVVLYMHPPSPDVIRMGMDIIRELGLRLRVSWYWTGSDEKELIAEMADMGRDPLWAKAGKLPIVVVGPTGMREMPQPWYVREFRNLRAAGIFAIGDSYAPPKEEMLDVMAGHYYYDTTGMYRSMWGGTNIEAAKPDGFFVTGYGHLFNIFDAISKITHAHGGVFLATVIPGFDNVSVHGFEDSPLYDGRPGTIVKRHDGATYAETWQAAMDSNADWVCIVSWNELHEGTEIEPTMEDGVKYINLTREWSEKFRASRK